MQGTGTNRRKIIFEIIAACILVVLVLVDQLTKHHFANTVEYGEKINVIDNFFYFTYVLNTGAAWSFLGDEAWAQIFFKILTAIALIAFVFFYFLSTKKGYKWLKIALVFVISGTLGNFIDRLLINAVIDFIGFTFGNYNFPVFNFADSFLVVGVIMIIIHLFFLDKNAIFKRKDGKKDN